VKHREEKVGKEVVWGEKKRIRRKVGRLPVRKRLTEKRIAKAFWSLRWE